MLKDYSKDEAYAELGRMIIWYKDCGASEETKDNLINLYSKIIDILDKEKEPKKYYLRHRSLDSEGVNYLNLRIDGKYSINDICESKSFKTSFNDKEIEEIEALGFDLCNFEKVEVEDE